jgi:DNA-binding MarR family transcriptional regulator
VTDQTEQERRMKTEDVSRLRRSIVRLSRQFNVSATDEGLTPSQASVLALVEAKGPIGLPALAEHEGINPTMLSRVISHLDEHALLRRTPDPTDLRSVVVEATPEGTAIAARIRAQRAAVVSACVEQLPAAQAAALVKALPALEALAEALRRSPAPTG